MNASALTKFLILHLNLVYPLLAKKKPCLSVHECNRFGKIFRRVARTTPEKPIRQLSNPRPTIRLDDPAVGPTRQSEHEMPCRSPLVDPTAEGRPRPPPKVVDDGPSPRGETSVRSSPRERDGLLQQPELRFAGQPPRPVARHRHRRRPGRQIEGSPALP
jgi:hypothetical protein